MSTPRTHDNSNPRVHSLSPLWLLQASHLSKSTPYEHPICNIQIELRISHCRSALRAKSAAGSVAPVSEPSASVPTFGFRDSSSTRGKLHRSRLNFESKIPLFQHTTPIPHQYSSSRQEKPISSRPKDHRMSKFQPIPPMS